MSQYSVRGKVAVITMSNPPMNTMSHANRGMVKAAVEAANADAAIAAIVITGGGKVFSSGAEIKEFNTPAAIAAPALGEVIAALDNSVKPIVAAVHGVAMGGGLELSLGCQYRVAAPGAQIALPEVKLGILPGAGGTQRLPRLIGAEAALEMIVSGNPVKSEKFAAGTLFDEIASGDLVEAACAFAEKVAAKGAPYKRARDLNVKLDNAAAFFEAARARVAKDSRGFPAPLKCVAAIEAAVQLPFDEGIKFERARFNELVQTSESKAMRHYFFGERAVSKIPDVPADTPLREIRRAAVIGAGTMGGGIAMNFVNAGIPVTLLEMKQEALDRGLAVVRKNYEGTAKKGRMTMDEVEKRMALITPTLKYADIGQADIVIEAVFEDMGVKEQVFKQLDEVMKPGAILASNTSTLDLDQVAAVTRRPADVIGTHFFSPANVMRLLEIVRGAKTGKDVLASTMKLAKTIKKVGVVSGVCDGFIGNRMVEQYLRQAYFLLEEGALPQQIDGALENWGLAMGPLRMMDLAGNDIGWAIRKRRYVEQPEMTYSKIPDLICELKRFGQKSGAGFYRYEAGDRTAYPDAIVEDIILGCSEEAGIKRRAISDEEIVGRCIYALVNEGARILEEGIAMRAVDIDMVYMTGYGFPTYRGGPMFYADTIGLPNVVAAMQKYAALQSGDPAFWKPAPLLVKLAAEGKTFN
ncbi:MAG TPA: 3-hydroxyacyl-CoA dehydrogenase NAD-binding domain-containing protein [Burkholderiales bacterium]|jgi:3-hydroxyacyl-CoA dehydrogenase|nr:3-hydroxyacyl-CoA dehydrogenase NAD-binding domain-containing protein [Burkholderiales bacterium]